MKILAIDQSQTGYCGLAIMDEQELLYSGIEKYEGIKSSRQRLKRFTRVIGSLFEEHMPDVVILEQVRLFHQEKINFDTIVVLSGLIALVEVIIPSQVPVWLVNTSSWKKGVLGNGRAGKDASVEYVQRCYGLSVSDDEADAILMAYYLSNHLRVCGEQEIKNIITKVK